jgi:hypothetical protein
MTSAYSSALTRDQWELLAPLIPGPKAAGRPRTVDWYRGMNAILDTLATWNTASVNAMLSLRCAYLNGQLAS